MGEEVSIGTLSCTLMETREDLGNTCQLKLKQIQVLEGISLSPTLTKVVSKERIGLTTRQQGRSQPVAVKEMVAE